MTGRLSRAGRTLYPLVSTPVGQALHVPGVLARLRLLDRVQLTPEGTSLAEAKRLTRALRGDDHRVFVLSYHSPSLQPGNTPYVRSDSDLQAFLHWLEDYLMFFFDEIGGVPATPQAIYDLETRRRAARNEGVGQPLLQES
jgi:hypothetical protein